jgi:hypothetical protein
LKRFGLVLLVVLSAPDCPAQDGGTGLRQPRFLERLTAEGADEEDRPDAAEQAAAWPNIHDPGPDMANFPNAAFTIPRGAAHVEFAPVGLYGPDKNTPPMFTTEYLLRYGLTDRLELRLFGNGYQSMYHVRPGQDGGSGFSPIAFDVKANFWNQPDDQLWLPSAGIEAFVQADFATKALREGTQAGLSLLFDHALPYEFQLEWNVGINTTPEPARGDGVEWNFQWALQRRFFDRLDVFTHGYINSASLPREGDGIVVGGGGIYSLSDRLALFGSYNAGLTHEAPTTFFQLGFALAF